MQNDFFEYNGQRYYAGTKFRMKKGNKLSDLGEIYTCVFIKVNDYGKYVVQYKSETWPNTKNNGGFRSYAKDELQELIVEIIAGNYYTELADRKKYVKDSDIPELYIGWFLYIFAMFGSSIFNGRVIGWTLLTILFFGWRHKVKERNIYYE